MRNSAFSARKSFFPLLARMMAYAPQAPKNVVIKELNTVNTEELSSALQYFIPFAAVI